MLQQEVVEKLFKMIAQLFMEKKTLSYLKYKKPSQNSN
jgi:hypothetical protein